MACAYRGCEKRYQTFSSTNFFYLPVDKRRNIWIQNSGNFRLKFVPASKKVRFCEDHFDPIYFRRQFSRTTLRRDAIPFSYFKNNEGRPSFEDRSKISLDMSQEDKVSTTIENEEIIELVTEVEISSFLHTDNAEVTFSNENHLEEDYLEDQTELVEIMEPSNYAELEKEESICSEIEKTFVDGSTQTSELAPLFSSTCEYDEDEHFVLSLMGPLRRLPKHMKISTRLSILEIIARCESQCK